MFEHQLSTRELRLMDFGLFKVLSELDSVEIHTVSPISENHVKFDDT
jgi:hypothetical protein